MRTVRTKFVAQHTVQRAKSTRQLVTLLRVSVDHVNTLPAVRMRLAFQGLLPVPQEVGDLAEEFLSLSLYLGVHVALDALQLPSSRHAPDDS